MYIVPKQTQRDLHDYLIYSNINSASCFKDGLLKRTSLSESVIRFTYNNWNEVEYVC